MKFRPHLAILPFLAALFIVSLQSGCSSNNPVSSGGTVYDTIRDTLKLHGDSVRVHDTIIVDTNGGGGGLTGTIKGTVGLIDTGCNQVTAVSGVIISVEGTSISTTCDAQGKYTLTKVPSGILTIDYTKPGYGITRYRNFQFIGNGTFYIQGSEYLWQLSPHVPKTDPVTMTSTQGINTYTFSGKITDLAPNAQKPNGWFFISKSPTIDYSNRSTYLGAYIGFSDGSNGMTSQVSTPFLFGLNIGDTAYVAFFVGVSCNQGQFDGGDGITDYEALAPATGQQGQMFVVQ